MLTAAAREQIGPLDPYAGVREVLQQTDATSLLDRLLYADIKTYLQELFDEAGSNEHGNICRKSSAVS